MEREIGKGKDRDRKTEGEGGRREGERERENETKDKYGNWVKHIQVFLVQFLQIFCKCVTISK
jgi:hypothetical protein